MKITTSEEMRALDALATDKYGIPSLLLMEHAGLAVAMTASDLLEGAFGSRVLVCAGPGNNGGDGFAAARHLFNHGANVSVLYFGDAAKASPDTRTNMAIVNHMEIPVIENVESYLVDQIISESDLVVDALLGIGVSSEVREPIAGVIRSINDFARMVLAVDIPSGVNSDTGSICGVGISADATVTFGLPKIGHFVYPGAGKVGRLSVADISIPVVELEDNGGRAFVLDRFIAGALIPYRPRDAHKGTFGHLAIAAGSVGMTGAAILTAEGALRIGTGLVTLAIPESLNDILEAKITEAMSIPVAEGSARSFCAGSVDAVARLIEDRDAVVIGPGLGRSEDAVSFVKELLPRIDRPCLVDADGLYAVAQNTDLLRNHSAPVIVTPHPGEMSLLTGKSISEVQSNRLETARSFATAYGVHVVLKGVGTIVAMPNGVVYINTSGTSGMATGGVGDVLSGIIGGLLAQGCSPQAACCAGVYIHGAAGEIAADNMGEAGMVAGDVAASIAKAVLDIQGED